MWPLVGPVVRQAPLHVANYISSFVPDREIQTFHIEKQ
jgi:hypothetical protein